MRFVSGPRSPIHAKTPAQSTRNNPRTPEIPRLLGNRAAILAAMTQGTITPKSNGPLIVEGPVRIVTPDRRGLTAPPPKDGKPAEGGVLVRCGGRASQTPCGGT